VQSTDVLNSERVCGQHFVSGKPALYRQKHKSMPMDWVPILQLGKKNSCVKLYHDANAERAEGAKRQEQLVVERQECKMTEKVKCLWTAVFLLLSTGILHLQTY